MKILMKLLIVVVVLTMSAQSFAQTFGVKFGLNLSNMVAKDEDDTFSDDFKYNPGLHLGPTAEFPISDNFSIETGLLATTKGFKMTEEGSGGDYSMNLYLLYVDVPVTAKASFDLGGVRIYAAAGPYVGAGIFGQYRSKITVGGESESDTEAVDWGSDADEDDFKRLDYGVTAGAGIEFGAVQIGASYGYGLANITPDTEGGTVVNNRVLGVSIGLKFGAK